MGRLIKGHGNWVDAERFFDRKQALADLKARIKEGGHCSLTAQRRMGKTSLARELCRQLKQSGACYCFFMDVEEAQLPEDVIKDMVVVTKGVQSLWEKGIGLFGNVLGGILDRIEEISAMEVGIKIRATDVDRVFKQVMLSVRGTSELEHYESRLKEVLGESLYTLALDMLTETAVNNTLDNHTLLSFKTVYQDYLDKADDAIKTVLYVLEHDGYIYSHANGYSFVLNLLKEWWIARHKTFYVPIKDRIK